MLINMIMGNILSIILNAFTSNASAGTGLKAVVSAALGKYISAKKIDVACDIAGLLASMYDKYKSTKIDSEKDKISGGILDLINQNQSRTLDAINRISDAVVQDLDQE